MKVSIIGLGEIGYNTLKEMSKKINCYGVDINEKRLKELKKKGYNVGKEILLSDVYIISVYTTEQVMGVITKLNLSNNPLIVIESTVLPGFCQALKKWKKRYKRDFRLVIFPHRFNPNDKEHYVFNLTRIMGCDDKETAKIALKFYTKFMKRKNIYLTSIKIAELCKPLENAYRFIEIAIAEEINMLCNIYDINFNKLRTAINTKWNIDLKDAIQGVGGKCLPKDINLISTYFKNNIMFDKAIKIDKLYRKYLGEK